MKKPEFQVNGLHAISVVLGVCLCLALPIVFLVKLGDLQLSIALPSSSPVAEFFLWIVIIIIHILVGMLFVGVGRLVFKKVRSIISPLGTLILIMMAWIFLTKLVG